jgi:hypothetical protein
MDDLVGRDDQLRAFERILDARRPAVVVVTGPVGSGKSRLLRELGVVACAHDWRIVAPPGEFAFAVTLDATPWSFAGQVQEALVAHAGARAFESNPVLDAYALSRGVAASAVAPPPAPPGADDLAASLIDAIRDLCPALVSVDGFRPNTGFADWCGVQLLPAIRRSGLPILAVLTLETEPELDILPHVDAHLELDRLDEAATERYFREVGRRLSPPMRDAELRAYVRASAARPELVHSLRRVLALAERPGR